MDGADYVLTDADKSEIAELAAELVEVPEAPEISMQPLTFTGAVEATYDGSKPVEVEIPQGGGGGWKKVAEYVWDGNKEYQPLALDYATGEMVFDTAPPARFAMWPVPNIDGVSNPVDLHSLYAKIPNEFLNAAPTSGMALSENGYTFGGVTKIAEGGVNANVDVSAFRFEVNNTVPSFSGLNAKRVKISFFAPGGNVFPNNNGFNFNAKLSNGQTVTLSAASGSSRLLYGWYEQDISVENNVLRNYFSLYGRFFKTRTSATQSGTNEKEGSVYPVFAVPDDVTIAEVYFSTGNGNFRPCNGTVVEVYVYED